MHFALQGKILWLRNVVGQPVVVDVPWFIGIMATLRNEKSACYERNGAQCSILPPDHPLITKKSLASLCAGLRADQVSVELRRGSVESAVLRPLLNEFVETFLKVINSFDWVGDIECASRLSAKINGTIK